MSTERSSGGVAAKVNGGSRHPWRDERGRMLPGHPGLPGAGRPPKLDLRSLIEARFARAELLGEGPSIEEALEQVVRALLDRATKGDVAAAQLLLRYLVEDPGKDVPAVVIDQRRVEIAPNTPTSREAGARTLAKIKEHVEEVLGRYEAAQDDEDVQDAEVVEPASEAAEEPQEPPRRPLRLTDDPGFRATQAALREGIENAEADAERERRAQRRNRHLAP